MAEDKVYTAIGLMSGTSLDGIDAALIRTDGRELIEVLDFSSFPYEAKEREVLRASLGKDDETSDEAFAADVVVTQAHIRALESLDWNADLIGFHGQTIYHDAHARVSVQIGNADELAAATGTDVVSEFRNADVAAGGQGAPFLPLYHQARARSAGLAFPLAILNLGGVGNVTWLGKGDDDILAFDTGPANALIDDFVKERTGQCFDPDGMVARAGNVDEEVLCAALQSSYFTRKPPKSLDRDEWGNVVRATERLETEDGAATLTALTTQSIKAAEMFFPVQPLQWFVTGGGRHNGFMMERLADALQTTVQPIDVLGWNGDGLEAEGFAYLAVRSIKKLPLSLPKTTGVPKPTKGGVLHKAA